MCICRDGDFMIDAERLVCYIDTLSWHIPDYLKDVERESRDGEVPIIRRSMQSFLQFLLHLTKPKAVLEIGTAIGFSGMLISECVPDGTLIDTIEKVPARIAAAKDNFAKYGKKERINLIEGDACDVLEELAKQGKQYDFVFMDAAKGQYSKYLVSVMEMLVSGGLLVTDNVLQDGEIIQSRYAVTRRDRTIHGRMREYLYELTHSEEFETVILSVGDGAAVSLKR